MAKRNKGGNKGPDQPGGRKIAPHFDPTTGPRGRLFTNDVPNTPMAKAVKAKGLGMGVGAWAMTGLDIVSNMKQGDSFGTATIKGVASGMMWATMPGIMTAQMLATTVPGAVAAFNQWKKSRGQWWNQQHLPYFGGAYTDTQRAQTMRQAAVQAIQGSKLNARSALGGEARILSQGFHRG